MIRRTATYSSDDGFDLLCCAAATGEVVWSRRMPSGIYTGVQLLGMMDRDTFPQVDGDCAEAFTGMRVSVSQRSDHQASAANPDFRPTPGAAQQALLMRTLSRVTTYERTLARRVALLERASAKPASVVDDPDPKLLPKADGAQEA